MRILIQVVKNANVVVDNKLVSEINNGELILVGFTKGDDEKVIDFMIEKLLKLRIFPDKDGKTNLNISQIDGEILAVSQFTLYADLTQGNRPSFVNALNYNDTLPLYDYFVNRISNVYPKVKFGIFGADMKVSLLNDGPFTITLDSKELL